MANPQEAWGQEPPRRHTRKGSWRCTESCPVGPWVPCPSPPPPACASPCPSPPIPAGCQSSFLTPPHPDRCQGVGHPHYLRPPWEPKLPGSGCGAENQGQEGGSGELDGVPARVLRPIRHHLQNAKPNMALTRSSGPQATALLPCPAGWRPGTQPLLSHRITATPRGLPSSPAAAPALARVPIRL